MPHRVPTAKTFLLVLLVQTAVWAQAPPRRELLQPFGPSTAPPGWPDFTGAPPAAGNIDFFAGAYGANAVGTQPLGTPLDGELFEPAETLAQVGDQFILKGELQGDANLILAGPMAQIENAPPDKREQLRREILEYRDQIAMQLLEPAIERKIKYLEFTRTLPSESDPKKIEERRNKIQEQAGKMFVENLEEMFNKVKAAKPEEYPEISRTNPQLYRVALVMKESNITSLEDPAFDRILRAHGTSIAKQRQAFMEYALGQAAIRQKVNFRPEITHTQMLDYYHEHDAEFQLPTRAKWEQMTVLFNRFPQKPDAWEEICKMGNEVLFGGAPFSAVAQRKSQEKAAKQGGLHDWTPIGDLKVSKQINDAVFTYPLNQLSPVIEDNEGLHIVRVLDRHDARQIAFTDVQDDIKEKLRVEMLNRAYNDYVANLKQKTPVVKATGAASVGRMPQPVTPGSAVFR